MIDWKLRNLVLWLAGVATNDFSEKSWGENFKGRECGE